MYWCVTVTLDILKVLLICTGIIGIKLNRSRLKYATAVYSACIVLILVLDFNSMERIYSNSCVLVTLIISFIVLEKKKYLSVLVYALEMLLESMSIIVYSLLSGRELVVLMENRILEVGISIAFIVLFIVMSLLNKHRRLESMGNTLNYKMAIMITVGVFGLCLSILSVNIVLSAGEFDRAFRQRSLIFTTVGTAMFIVIIILFIVKDYLVYQYKEKNKMMLMLANEQYKYCNLLVEKSEETRKIRHDMDNHIRSIIYLLQDNRVEETKEYVRVLSERINELKIKNYVGNNLIDAMLLNLQDKFDEVRLTVEGVFPKEINMSLIDLSTIFYNLLNNAFEAAGASNEKYVDIRIRIAGNSFVFELINSVDAKVEINDNRIQTSKHDKENHGYGIENAATYINKYGGRMELSCDDKEFKTEIVFLNIIIEI